MKCPSSAATFVVLLGGCGTVSGPGGSVPFDPPADAYRVYWQADLDCAGIAGSPDGWRVIRWWEAPPDGEGKLDCGGTPAYGCWVPRHDIYLLASTANDAYVIRHEMLHDLLNDPTHTEPAWTSCHLR